MVSQYYAKVSEQKLYVLQLRNKIRYKLVLLMLYMLRFEELIVYNYLFIIFSLNVRFQPELHYN